MPASRSGHEQRIHSAASRVKLLSEQTPTGFVAFDMLAIGDEDLTERHFGERHDRLVEVLKDARPPVYVTSATEDLATAERWFGQFGGPGWTG